MDGLGWRSESYGNAVHLAHTPCLDFLQKNSLFTTLKAHGPYVGLPLNSDMGNSEVGHNAMGAGRIFDQGAKLVNNSLNNAEAFKSETWKQILRVKENNKTLHLIGLLSDGNVHSQQEHLHRIIYEAAHSGVKKIRVHVLLDGRDVAEKSAEIYAQKLEKFISLHRSKDCDIQVASGGGRMTTTMDRYEADWSIVERGWKAHVLGQSENNFPSLSKAIEEFRKKYPDTGDQYLPDFIIKKDNKACGPIVDGDAVLFFNFRGDRAIEISKAFDAIDFPYFDRIRKPKVFYAGMMQYDGDEKIPKNYLITAPEIKNTFSEFLVNEKVKQFACSETQKFGHVTYFWNGNKSGYFNKSFEHYLEIKSDKIAFDKAPWMQAAQITDACIKEMNNQSFDFYRINLANGDMVGHTGNLEASIIAVSTIDLMLSRLIQACRKSHTMLIVTADHGNCETMLAGDASIYPHWKSFSYQNKAEPITSHTTEQVPCFIYDPSNAEHMKYKILDPGKGTLANLANTCMNLIGFNSENTFHPSLLSKAL